MRRFYPLLPRVPRVLALAALLLLAMPVAALAQCPQTTLGEVEKEVLCPVCGTPLALATEAPQAIQQREFIVARVERCESKEEIKTALAAEFGEDVLASPDDEGFDLVAYVLPGLALLGAGGAMVYAAVRWRRGRARSPAPAGAGTETSGSSADSQRLQRDLERYDL